MLVLGRWQVTLGDVLLAATSEPVCSPLEAAIRNGDVACRVDSMDPSAQFSFSHRTIAEYLAASGLWARPQVLPGIPSPSLAKNLVSSAGLATSAAAMPRCERGCAVRSFSLICWLLTEWPPPPRRLPTLGPPPSRPTPWHLWRAAAYPLDGTSVVNRYITQCNLRHADLSGCDLSGTTFELCELQNANFTFATVEGTVFRGCDFGLLCDVLRTDCAVTAVCATLDSRYIVSGSIDKSVRMWDVATGREVRKFEGHTDKVMAVSVAHDGRHVVSGSADNSLRLWIVDTGREMRKLDGRCWLLA